MKISLKNVKNALERDEMRTLSGGSSSYTQACQNDSYCPSGKKCDCSTCINGNSVKICC